MLTLNIAGLTLSRLQKLRLSEACNGHTRLQAWGHVQESLNEVMQAVGAEVSLAVPWQGDTIPLFQGQVERMASRGGDVYCIEAVSPSWPLDLVSRTRSFVAAEPDPVAICELPGFDAAFATIENRNRLQSRLTVLTQYRETDWVLLKRLAALNGLFVVCAPEGTIALEPNASSNQQVTAADILRDSERVSVRMGVPASRSSHWDWRRGDAVVPQQAEAVATSLDWLQRALEAGRAWAGQDAYQDLFPQGLPVDTDDYTHAERHAKASQSRLFSWSGSLHDPRIHCGMGLQLPPEYGITEPLLVFRRTLTYDAASCDFALVNRVKCTSNTLTVPRSQRFSVRPPELIFGQVVAVDDPWRIGRVKVQFPWSGDAEQGVWCHVPQPCAGQRQSVVNLPAPDEWVVCLFQPDSHAPPVVLGAFYHEQMPLPEMIDDPAGKRLLVLMEDGRRILLDEQTKTLEVAAGEGCDRATVILGRGRLEIAVGEEGNEAKLVLEPGSVEIHATQSVTIAAENLAIQSNVTVQNGNAVTVEGGDLTIQGGSVSLT